ncbi:MAG: preprotein translocase subunit SecE [bacterium]
MSESRKKAQVEKQGNLVSGLKSYFKGVKSEWGKITWPEKKQVYFETLLVIAVVIFFTVVVYCIDKFYLFLILVLQHYNVIPKVG